MILDEKYRAQVDLLLQILPDIANAKVFAHKGGTAINMFERNLPRLSKRNNFTIQFAGMTEQIFKKYLMQQLLTGKA